MPVLRRVLGPLAVAAIFLTYLVVTGFSKVGSFSGGFSAAPFASSDLSGVGTLDITPSGGFTGAVTVTFNRTITNPPPPWQPLPSTVTVTAPGSPVSIAGTKTVRTPIDFSWTSFPVGYYEVIANLTSGSLSTKVTLQIIVKSSHVSVTTWHNDGLRTGQNPLESTLTTSNVNSNSFGKLFEHLTNGGIEGQPLYVPSVYIEGAFHDVVYVATMNDMVYAFDANDINGADANPLWTANVGPVAPAGTGGGGDSYNQGAVSTPVIDTYLNAIYVVSKNVSNGVAYNELHALDLSTGKEKFKGPKQIAATINRTVGGANGQVVFQPDKQYQRVGLLLLNGVVYIGFGGLDGDPGPCRGWVMGYNAETLAQTCAYTSCPDAGAGSQTAFAGGGIWMSGAGLATDGTYIYATTGNGDFDANNSGGKDYGDSVVKLLPNGTGMTVADFFTPNTQQTLADDDLDLGSSGPMILPSSAASTQLIMQLSKTSEVYLLNQKSMGGYNASADNVFQEFSSSGGAFHCNPAYYNKAVYFASDGGPLTAYSVTNSGLNTTPFGTSSEGFDQASPSISYNQGLTNPASSAIVWIVENSGNGTLIAYKATDLTELFSGDTGAPYMKNNVPTIANGKVYVACEDRLVVFGLN